MLLFPRKEFVNFLSSAPSSLSLSDSIHFVYKVPIHPSSSSQPTAHDKPFRKDAGIHKTKLRLKLGDDISQQLNLDENLKP